MSAEVGEAAAEPEVEYVRPDWEKAKHAAQADAAREDIRYLLRHVETQEGMTVPVDESVAICDRRYRVLGGSLGSACP